METITIPKKEYLEMVFLFQKMKEKFDIIVNQQERTSKPLKFDIMKYCGIISLKEDPLQIQKKMRE